VHQLQHLHDINGVQASPSTTLVQALGQEGHFPLCAGPHTDTLCHNFFNQEIVTSSKHHNMTIKGKPYFYGTIVCHIAEDDAKVSPKPNVAEIT
jgi:hypothetical protein